MKIADFMAHDRRPRPQRREAARIAYRGREGAARRPRITPVKDSARPKGTASIPGGRRRRLDITA